MTMDDVMKWFILLLIVVGDPMAVIMVIIFNKVINYGKNSTNIEGLPMGDLIGDKPKENKLTFLKKIKGHLKKDFKHPLGQDKPSELINDIEEPEQLDNDIDVEIEHEDEVIEAKEEHVFIPPVPEIKDKKPSPEFKPKEEFLESESNVVKREDIKEIKEREKPFSVNVPSRKKGNNSIERIGSNKEVRGNKTDTVFFKRR